MRRGRAAAVAFAIAGFCAVQAEAGNGSNFIHLINGAEYLINPLPLPPAGNLINGVWRCFDEDMLHSPTRVANAGDPLFGTYATKICGIHITMQGNTPTFRFPNVVASHNEGDCRFLTTATTSGLNFAAVNFTGIPPTQNGAVIGPANDPGAPGTGGITANFLVGNIAFPSAGPNFLQVLYVDVFNLFVGLSAVPIPEGENLTIWVHDSNTMSTPGNVQYFMVSGDERMVCSAQSASFIAAQSVIGGPIGVGQLPAGGAAGTLGGWEWGVGVAHEDATTTAIVSSLQNGIAPLGGVPNANSDVTWPAGGFDAGQASRKISLTGTTMHASGSLGTETISFATYDELNDHVTNKGFPAVGRLTLFEIYAANTAPQGANDCHDGPASLASGYLHTSTINLGQGPLALLNGVIQSRIVGDFDNYVPGSAPNGPPGSGFYAFAPALLSNTVWLTVSAHDTVVGGMDIPYLPIPSTGVSGACGRTNPGTGIDIPASLIFTPYIGANFMCYSWPLNGATPAPLSSSPITPTGTGIAAGANNGHSLSNGYTFSIWP